MITRFKQVISNPLFSGSVIMIIGINLSSALNYLYHLIMGRLLGPIGYGELASLFSLIGILGTVPSSLGLVVTKFVSQSKGTSEVKDLLGWLNKRILIGSFLLFFLITAFSPLISSFLRINDMLLIWLSAATFIFTLPTLVNWSTLQGLILFKEYVENYFISNLSKLIFGVILVAVGLGVQGVFGGLLLSCFVTWYLSAKFISKKLPKKTTSKPNILALSNYSLPIIIQALAIASFYSTDVLLVKHFFSPFQAGIYAADSTLGKIIFFSVTPICSVMFPLVSRKQSRNEEYKKIFLYSLGLGSLLSLLIIIIFITAPKFSIALLYGRSYLEGASLIGWFGVFMFIFTLCYLFINFFLSIGKTKVVILPLLGAILQFIGIWLFHSNLEEVVLVSIAVTTLLLLCLFVYFAYVNQTYISNSTSLSSRKDDNTRFGKN